jgi:hypothetical protein
LVKASLLKKVIYPGSDQGLDLCNFPQPYLIAFDC